MMSRLRGAALGLAGVLLAAGCAAGDVPIRHIDGASALPTETLQDWVTYGDAFVSVTVKSEEELPLDEVEKERGEGMTPRRLTTDVDRKGSWQRAGRKGPEVPADLEITQGGWIYHGGKKVARWAANGEVWPEVGEHFAVLLSYTDLMVAVDRETRKINRDDRSPGAQWAVAELIPLDGDQAAPTLEQRADESALGDIAGKTVPEITALLDATSPDPAAEKYMDLDPFVRYQMTKLDQATTPSPGPGEKV